MCVCVCVCVCMYICIYIHIQPASPRYAAGEILDRIESVSPLMCTVLVVPYVWCLDLLLG